MNALTQHNREQEQLAKWAGMSKKELSRKQEEKAAAIAHTKEVVSKAAHSAVKASFGLGNFIAIALAIGVVAGVIGGYKMPAPSTIHGPKVTMVAKEVPNTPYVATIAPGAAVPLDMDKLNSMGAIIGKGMGCGLNVQPLMNSATAYINSATAAGSDERKQASALLGMGSQVVAEMQRSGGYSESCSSVAAAYRNAGY